MEIPLPVQLLYYIVYFIAVILSITLFYCLLRVQTHGPKACYVMMANIAFLDLMICTTMTLLIPRQISYGVSVIFYPGGLCTAGGLLTCQVMTAVWLTFLAQNIMALSICFAYRTFILYRGTIGVGYGFLLSALPYFITLPVVVLAITNQITGTTIDEIILSADLPLDGMRFGYKNFLDLPGIIIMTYAFYQTPFHIILMFYFKYKATRLLDGHQNLSKRTIDTHRQLIKVLSIQILLPIVHLFNVCLYLLRQFDIIHVPELEYGTTLGIHLVSALSPGVSLYNVQPFREALLAPLRGWKAKHHIESTDASHEKRGSRHSIEPHHS